MSTGYEFSKLDIFHAVSHIDRMIRVTIAKHIPLGVYFPEPNFCVLLPTDHTTLPESFIDKSIRNGKSESAALLRKVKERTNFTCIFSDLNPIITKTPL